MKSLKKSYYHISFRYLCYSLKDGWISGITDSEGCFTSSLISDSSAYRLRYILTQKWEANKHVLKHIMNMFFPSAGRLFGSKDVFLTNGCVVPHSAPGVWELRVNGVKKLPWFISLFWWV